MKAGTLEVFVLYCKYFARLKKFKEVYFRTLLLSEITSNQSVFCEQCTACFDLSRKPSVGKALCDFLRNAIVTGSGSIVNPPYALLAGHVEHFADKCGGVPAWLDKNTYYTAFTEGWGLYSENPILSDDTDTYKDNLLQKYGMAKWQVRIRKLKSKKFINN